MLVDVGFAAGRSALIAWCRFGCVCLMASCGSSAESEPASDASASVRESSELPGDLRLSALTASQREQLCTWQGALDNAGELSPCGQSVSAKPLTSAECLEVLANGQSCDVTITTYELCAKAVSEDACAGRLSEACVELNACNDESD